MENVVAWLAILGGMYAFVPSFRRMVHGWIVQLGDRVRHDAELPVNHEPPVKHQGPSDQLVEETALMMFRSQNPGSDNDLGFEGISDEARKAVRSYYLMRARAFLSGQDMDEFDASLKNRTN